MHQKLGQHFLINRDALAHMAERVLGHKPEVVIEIGPGHGELTEELRRKNYESRIIAIEKDPKLAQGLRERFVNSSNIEIIEGDALQLLPSLASKLKAESYQLAGNIPYYITGHLMRVLSELSHKPSLCLFTVQKEVAVRMVESAPHMNRLAAAVQYWAKPKILRVLPRQDFRPPPAVESAMVELQTIPNKHYDPLYYRALHILFQQPRKTLLNNLLAGTPLRREEAEDLLSDAGLQAAERPQNLTVERIAAVAKTLVLKIWG